MGKSVKFRLVISKYFLIPTFFLGETRAELHIDQANVARSVLREETQYIKLFKSLFVIFAINYKLLEKHQV